MPKPYKNVQLNVWNINSVEIDTCSYDCCSALINGVIVKKKKTTKMITWHNDSIFIRISLPVQRVTEIKATSEIRPRITSSGRSRGGAWRSWVSPYVVTKLRPKGPKNFFLRRPPLPIWKSGSATDQSLSSCTHWSITPKILLVKNLWDCSFDSDLVVVAHLLLGTERHD